MFFILCRNGCARIAFPSLILKFILFMKLVLFIIFITCMQVSASALAQKITLSEQDVSLKKILREIRKQSDVDFIVKTTQLQQSNPVTINVTNQPLERVLEQIFQ